MRRRIRVIPAPPVKSTLVKKSGPKPVVSLKQKVVAPPKQNVVASPKQEVVASPKQNVVARYVPAIRHFPSNTFSKFGRVLVIGNSPHMRCVLPDMLAPDVVTVGINRLYHWFWPRILFFSDPEIVDELLANEVDVPRTTTMYTTEHFYRRLNLPDTTYATDKDRIHKFVHERVQILRLHPAGDAFTTHQAILAMPNLIHTRGAPLAIYLAGVTMDERTSGYGWTAERCALNLDRQFSKLTEIMPHVRGQLINTNPIASRVGTLMTTLPLKCLNATPLHIIHRQKHVCDFMQLYGPRYIMHNYCAPDDSIDATSMPHFVNVIVPALDTDTSSTGHECVFVATPPPCVALVPVVIVARDSANYYELATRIVAELKKSTNDHR